MLTCPIPAESWNVSPVRYTASLADDSNVDNTWDTQAIVELGDYLTGRDPSAGNTSPSEAHLVTQANIWVTYAVARLVIK